MKRFLIACAAALVLAGCSSTPAPNLERYSLLDGISAGAHERTGKIRVCMAGSLAEPGLVLRISPVIVRPAKYHQWDMAPEQQLEILLNDALARGGVKPRAAISVQVSRFDGDLDGNVTVAASLHAKLSSGKDWQGEAQWNGRQSEDGYASLAQSLGAGFKSVAAELVSRLKAAGY